MPRYTPPPVTKDRLPELLGDKYPEFVQRVDLDEPPSFIADKLGISWYKANNYKKVYNA
jgi:hypothetical protein